MAKLALHLVVGTRPEVVQAFPLAEAAARLKVDLTIVLVSQHTDPIMSAEVLPTQVTARWKTEHVDVLPFSLGAALTALTRFFADRPPQYVIVIGDTDTSLAAALAATEQRIPVGHVEAGLRSHDWEMKEERNRVLIDHLATALFAPTEDAVRQLQHEHAHGIVANTGDVHVDAFRLLREQGVLLSTAGTAKRNYVCTLHRRENILTQSRLAHLVDLLGTSDRPISFYVHPHTMRRLDEFGLLNKLRNTTGVSLEAPLPFLAFAQAVANAAGVVTDSGGVQKQAYLLHTPCLTLRTATEWTDTLLDGWNTLADPENLAELPRLNRPSIPPGTPFGDGHAAERIMRTLLREVGVDGEAQHR